MNAKQVAPPTTTRCAALSFSDAQSTLSGTSVAYLHTREVMEAEMPEAAEALIVTAQLSASVGGDGTIGQRSPSYPPLLEGVKTVSLTLMATPTGAEQVWLLVAATRSICFEGPFVVNIMLKSVLLTPRSNLQALLRCQGYGIITLHRFIPSILMRPVPREGGVTDRFQLLRSMPAGSFRLAIGAYNLKPSSANKGMSPTTTATSVNEVSTPRPILEGTVLERAAYAADSIRLRR
ncbi:hypothetical protein FZEAL_8490 [Fusarium zealandicum]|uniref:Uncharacterized protein n=1 Tax=Fusarium zealandicum TaxID=1053134 RepID=A0A8H4UDR4_9HYPO|nr:hypothetical protein FZEAL_8490 [Fusarium zealandicum]